MHWGFGGGSARLRNYSFSFLLCTAWVLSNHHLIISSFFYASIRVFQCKKWLCARMPRERGVIEWFLLHSVSQLITLWIISIVRCSNMQIKNNNYESARGQRKYNELYISIYSHLKFKISSTRSPARNEEMTRQWRNASHNNHIGLNHKMNVA